MPLDPHVKAIKIHPAIGVARVSTNDDAYVAGEEVASYKTQGLMRRQAVPFRLFAFSDNNEGLEELTAARLEVLGIDVMWRARVGNRKIARQRDESFAILVEGASDQNAGKLVGQLSGFAEGAAVPLGEIHGDGVFIPPKAGIFRETTTTPIPNGGPHNPSISDNVGDGFITATLTDRATGAPVSVPVLPACA